MERNGSFIRFNLISSSTYSLPLTSWSHAAAEVRLPQFEFWLWCFTSCVIWARYLASLSLVLLIYARRILVAPTS